MNELKCTIVRDLLPLYVDGLTSVETSTEIENHLKNCENCRKILNEMSQALVPVKAEQKEEIDYLKKVKKRNHKKIIGAVLAAVIVIIGALSFKAFVWGEPIDQYTLAWSCVEENNILSIEAYSTYSAKSYCGWQWDSRTGNKGKIIEIKGRQVLSSFLSEGYYQDNVPLEGVERVYLCGVLIWQDGMIIDREVSELLDSKTLYIGNIAAGQGVAEALRIAEQCGAFTSALSTSAEPYGWQMNFIEPLKDAWSEEELNRRMQKNSYFLVALIDNLSIVRWSYTDSEGEQKEQMVTVEELNQTLPALVEDYNERYDSDLPLYKSVKAYAQSAKDLQILYDLLN